MIGREGGRKTNRHPDEATPGQGRLVRRLLGRYVRRVEGEKTAFDRPLDAVAYALARHALTPRDGLYEGKHAAHDWIDTLSQPEDAEQDSLRILDLARRRGRRYSAWRVAALTPLADLYGYPREQGWLDRLNDAIAERFEDIEDEALREKLLREPSAYRATVVDPCFGVEHTHKVARAGDGIGGTS